MRKLKYIKGIGVELEGAWCACRHPSDTHPIYNHMGTDGSVHISINDIRNTYTDEDRRLEGEFSSTINVGEMRVGVHKSLENLYDDMKLCYPDFVNSSCGFHIHVSTNEINYARLMRTRFNKLFNEKMEKLIKDMHKLRGDGRKNYKYTFGYNDQDSINYLTSRFRSENQYCRANFQPLRQCDLSERHSERYAHLNYCHELHGTLECRLFNMMPHFDESWKLLEYYIDIIEDYLSKYGEFAPMPSYKTGLVQEIKSTIEYI